MAKLSKGWTKTSPWGDYRDPLQNHKFDGELHFVNKDCTEVRVYNRIRNILHEARWHYGKHIGSKKLGNIIAFNRQVNSTRAAVKKAVAASKQNEEDVSEAGE